MEQANAVLLLIQAEAERQTYRGEPVPILTEFSQGLKAAGALLRKLAAFPVEVINQAVTDACYCQHSRCTKDDHCGRCQDTTTQTGEEHMEKVKELMQQRAEIGEKVIVEMQQLFPVGTLLKVSAGRGKAEVKVVGYSVDVESPTRLVVENTKTQRLYTVDGLNPGLGL